MNEKKQTKQSIYWWDFKKPLKINAQLFLSTKTKVRINLVAWKLRKINSRYETGINMTPKTQFCDEINRNSISDRDVYSLCIGFNEIKQMYHWFDS